MHRCLSRWRRRRPRDRPRPTTPRAREVTVPAVGAPKSTRRVVSALEVAALLATSPADAASVICPGTEASARRGQRRRPAPSFLSSHSIRPARWCCAGVRRRSAALGRRARRRRGSLSRSRRGPTHPATGGRVELDDARPGLASAFIGLGGRRVRHRAVKYEESGADGFTAAENRAPPPPPTGSPAKSTTHARVAPVSCLFCASSCCSLLLTVARGESIGGRRLPRLAVLSRFLLQAGWFAVGARAFPLCALSWRLYGVFTFQPGSQSVGSHSHTHHSQVLYCPVKLYRTEHGADRPCGE